MSQHLFLIGAAVENVLAPRTSSLVLAGFPSGQRDQTVNLTAMPSKVRILLPPPCFAATLIDENKVVCCEHRYAGMVQW